MRRKPSASHWVQKLPLDLKRPSSAVLFCGWMIATVSSVNALGGAWRVSVVSESVVSVFRQRLAVDRDRIELQVFAVQHQGTGRRRRSRRSAASRRRACSPRRGPRPGRSSRSGRRAGCSPCGGSSSACRSSSALSMFLRGRSVGIATVAVNRSGGPVLFRARGVKMQPSGPAARAGRTKVTVPECSKAGRISAPSPAHSATAILRSIRPATSSATRACGFSGWRWGGCRGR